MSSPYPNLLQRIHNGLSAIELVHSSHPRWPLPPHTHSAVALAPTVRISVLDSSFNPPTLAHLALANIPSPPPTNVPSSGYPHDFDPRLLLLSVRNADKQLKPGDAAYEQRTDMIVLLARDLARTRARSVPAPQHAPPEVEGQEEAARAPNVAVAIIDEPTFVGKSAILHDFLTARIAALLGPSPAPSPTPTLTFLMGTDTVVRLFAPRYYASDAAMHAALRRFFSPSPDGDDSRLVCARRVSHGVPRAEEERIEVEMAAVARTVVPFERLVFVDIGEREATYSSSQVRELRAQGDERWREMVTPAVAEYITANNLYLAS